MKSEFFIAFIFFLIASLLFTFPLILNFNSSYFGIPGESGGFIWQNWWFNFAAKHGLNKNFCPLINAPFGFELNRIPSQLIPDSLSALLAGFFGEVAAYNLLVLLSFLLSGFFMFLLVKELTENFWVSIFSGLYYTLVPFHYSHLYHVLNLGDIFWLPLYLLFLIKLFKNPKIIWVGLTALFLAAVILDNFYYGFFTLIFSFFLILIIFLMNLLTKPATFYFFIDAPKMRKIFLFLALAFVLLLPFVIPHFLLFQTSKTASPIVAQNFSRFYADLFRYSAKPLEYILPSVDHPFWGGLSQKYFQHHLHSSNLFEQTLYLGYLPLFLTMVGFFLSRKKAEEKMLFRLFLLAGLFALYTSLSPTPRFLGIKLVAPSFFLYKFFPMFRVYSRMAIFVIICLAVTSGLSLKWLLEKIKNNRTKKILIFGAMALVVLEFINFPPQKLVSLKPSDSSLWLASQTGDFIVAQYPLASSIEPIHFVYVLEQRIHRKKLLNGALSGTYPDQIRSEVIDLNNPRTAPFLARLGVKYVVINKNIFKEGRVPPETRKYFDPSYLENQPAEWNNGVPFDLKKNNNFKLAASFKEADIYKVITNAADLQIVWAENFWPPERWKDKHVWRWLWQDGVIEITNFSQKPKKLFFDFKARSFAQARSLSAFLDNNLLKKWEIPQEKIIQLTPLSLKVPTGKHFLKFTAQPGPQNIHQTIGNLDGRDVSVALSKSM